MFITCEPESKSNPNHQRHIQERHVRTSPQVSVSPNVPIPGLSQPLLFVNRCPGPLVQCSKLLRRHGGSNHSGEPSFGMEAGRKAIAPSGFRSITSTRRRASYTRAKHKDASGPRRRHIRPQISPGITMMMRHGSLVQACTEHRCLAPEGSRQAETTKMKKAQMPGRGSNVPTESAHDTQHGCTRRKEHAAGTASRDIFAPEHPVPSRG